MPFTDLPAVLKPEEVASYLQVRPETVYEDITAGRLNAIRIGNELRIRKEDLLSTSFAPDHVVTSAPGESLVVAQIERALPLSRSGLPKSPWQRRTSRKSFPKHIGRASAFLMAGFYPF